MSQADVEAFRRGVDAVNRGDVEAAAAMTHPDAILEPLRAATEGAFFGCEGIRKFFEDTAETFDVFEVGPLEVSELGDHRVLAIGSIRVRGRGGGVDARIPTATIAEYRDGLLWRYKDYSDAGAAREAAGLADEPPERQR